MKKIVGWTALIAVFCVISSACSKSETYADKLKNERKEIKNFISDHNIVVLNNYPSDGVFKDNEFYLDGSGVYINVVDSGNGKRANADNRAEVSYRFWDTMTLPAASADTVTNDVGGLQPLSFTYGRTGTYTSANTSSLAYAYLSPGITVPLKYVGENAVVRLIVPFSSGSTYQNAAFKAVYYGKLKYTTIIN